MKVLENISHIYFVGIGGIGMSALARFAMLKGLKVSGYDKTRTKLTDTLSNEGMEITFTDSSELVTDLLPKKDNILVIYTPAVPKNNQILNWFQDHDFVVMKRAAFLGEVTKGSQCLAVAGTHGKTTTTAILGHLLAYCKMPVTAFLGGIAHNYNSNFIGLGTEITVVEADEFDRSFLTLHPNIAGVTSMDADHLDIYGDENAIEDAFQAFASLVENKQNLLHKRGLPLNGQTVAIEEEAAFEVMNVSIKEGGYHFDLKTPSMILSDLQFYLPGHHNLHNAAMALGMALKAGAPAECLPKALSSFTGVDRRFSYKIRRDDLVLIDDYAHHPTELNALYQAVSEMYPKDEKIIVFQPHLFSRTRDFASGFAKSLAQFDQVLLLDIYPAREEPITGITSEWLAGMIRVQKEELGSDGDTIAVIQRSELGERLRSSNCRIQLLVGAGDIGDEVGKITKMYSDEN